MPLNKRISRVGIAKQTSKGSAASQPTYVFGVESGVVMESPIVEPDIAVTASSRMSAAAVRDTVIPGASFTTLGFSRSLGLLIYGALGTEGVTGAGDPYTHTQSAPTADLPWLTLFFQYGSTEYGSVADCKMDSLKLEFDTVGLLKVTAVIKGCTLTLGASAWTPTNTDDEVTPGCLYTAGVAGNFTLDSVTTRMTKGSVEVMNNLGPIIPAYKVTPDDFGIGEQAGKLSVTFIPDDLSFFKKAVTATGSGTSVAQAPYYAAASLKFVEGPGSSTHDLIIATARSPLNVKMPVADPKGGAAELVADGSIYDPRTGSPGLTCTLRNSVATY